MTDTERLHDHLIGARRRPLFLDLCDEAVTRKGELVPCEKVAAAVRIDPDGDHPYAVCGHHARGALVPLAEILTWTES